MRKRKKKEIQLLQKFNPGTMKYEPELLLRKARRKPKVKIKWMFIAIFIILVMSLLIILFAALGLIQS